DGRRDDVVAPPRERARGSAEREVVGLGAAAREDDLARLAPERPPDLRARLLERPRRLDAAPVEARGVPETLSQEGEHGRDDFRRGARGRGVVEVDLAHGVERRVKRQGAKAPRKDVFFAPCVLPHRKERATTTTTTTTTTIPTTTTTTTTTM